MTQNETPKNYGFVFEEILPDEHYILGSSLTTLPVIPIQPTGQWDAFIPADEIQRNEKYETYNCTSFGTLNALEFLFKRLFNETKDWSERYVGIAAGTRPPGNSPHKVIETIRKDCGLLDDIILPMSKANTVEEYYAPDPLPWFMKENGRKFISDYIIGHEWVFNGGTLLEKQTKIKEALKYSPLGVSVYAWEKQGDYYVKPKGVADNHWTVLFGYAEGQYWQIFDSYDSTIKHLAWDYEFGQAKRYHIEVNTYKGFWRIIINYLKEFIK